MGGGDTLVTKTDDVDCIAEDGEDDQDGEQDHPDDAGAITVRRVGILKLKLRQVVVCY